MLRRPELEDPELEPLLEEVGWVQAEEEVALEDQLSAMVLADQSSEDEVIFEWCQYGLRTRTEEEECDVKGRLGSNIPGEPKLAHCSKWPRREWQQQHQRKKRSHQTRQSWKMQARRMKKRTKSGQQQHHRLEMWSRRNREFDRFGRAS